MKRFTLVLSSILGVSTFLPTTSHAYESGFPGFVLNPGVTIGGTTAGAPGPGLYMFDQVSTFQGRFKGPGAPNVAGVTAPIDFNGAAIGLLWAPGWQFLGATYDAVVVQPAVAVDFGAPLNLMKAGLRNTYINPLELSWKLGNSGFYVKAGLGFFSPDGAISGANGLASNGNP